MLARWLDGATVLETDKTISTGCSSTRARRSRELGSCGFGRTSRSAPSVGPAQMVMPLFEERKKAGAKMTFCISLIPMWRCGALHKYKDKFDPKIKVEGLDFPF